MRWLPLVGALGLLLFPSSSQAQPADSATGAYARRIEGVADAAAIVADSLVWDTLDAVMSVLPGSKGPPRHSLDSASRVMGWARRETRRRRESFAGAGAPPALRSVHEELLGGLDTLVSGLELMERRVDRCRTASAGDCAGSLLDGLELTGAGRTRYDEARRRATRLLAERSVTLAPPREIQGGPARRPR